MFTALRYITLFLLAYKVFRMLFGGNQQRKTVPQQPFRNPIQEDNTKRYSPPQTDTKFSDAEFIDYEEVK